MPPIPVGCLPYPQDWPADCFRTLRDLYSEGRLFEDLATTHHCVWTIQGFFAGKFLGQGCPDDVPLRPIGERCPCDDDCLAAMRALADEAEGIKAACQASQGMLGDVLKSALAEVVRQGLPSLLDLVNRYLDSLNL